MAETLAKEGETYLIFSSGASEENEMHRLRTLGILDTLQKIYGVEFEQSPEELAVVDEPTNVEAGDLKFTIFPGYLESEENSAAAAGLAASGEYTTILSTVPVSPIKDTLDTLDIHCGAIDCFSEDNYYGFRNGTISYVAGKYQSESDRDLRLYITPSPATPRRSGKTEERSGWNRDSGQQKAARNITRCIPLPEAYLSTHITMKTFTV